MAGVLVLVNTTGFVRGIRNDETGINIKEFKTKVEPEFTEELKDRVNTCRGFAQGPMMATVTISGEVNTGLTGVMASVLGTSLTTANSRAYFGAPSTGLYLMNGEVTEAREGWLDMTGEWKSYAGVP